MTMAQKTLAPFGLLVTSEAPGAPLAIEPAQIHAWLTEHRMLLLRGFAPLVEGKLPAFCATLGEPLRWEFGLVNELVVKADTRNYLYTNRDVPFHWDGAFVGRVPRYIFFHCVEAPPEDAGGETLFSDVVRLVAGASEEELSRWRKIEIEYTTEKVVHYGGRFRARLLDRHPLTGEPVLRFAEPVRDLNPVSLKIDGLPPDGAEAFLADMHERLRRPDVCHAHVWRSGDVLIADNHALLHGRRPFKAQAPRHIRRVNLMSPPSRGRLTDLVLDNLFIRRFEYFVAEIPIVAVPLLVSLRDAAFFSTRAFWEGVVVFFLLFNFGDMINCLADRDLDRVYKPHLSRAVYRLGVGNVKAQIALTALGALAISAHLSWKLHNPLLVPLVAVGLGLGAAYSVPPVRLKGRGVLQVICLWLIIFVGPMLFTSTLVAGFPPPIVFFLAVAYATVQMGVILFNTAEDHPEDSEAGVITTVVALGLHRGIGLAVAMAAFGGVATLATFAEQYVRRGVPSAAFAALALPALAYGIVVRSMWRVHRAIAPLPVAQAVQRVKDVGRLVPVWVTAVAWSTMIAALVLFTTSR